MFLRKKPNKSGSVSIQVVDKSEGKYRVITTIGCSSDIDEIERLVIKGEQFIQDKINDSKQGKLFSTQSRNDKIIQSAIESLSSANINTIGPELIFGALFDRMGFNQIKDEVFRHLVISRLAYPTSKLKTIDYIYRYKGEKLSLSSLFRFLDNLQSKHKKEVEKITYKHTKKRLKNISVAFYDVATLYFETESEDDLRKMGFSKDGKFHKPQIMLGILTGDEGLPISYDIFQGNAFEGHTIIPFLKKVEENYGFKKPIVVADAAMLSKSNIEKLEHYGYKYIVGGRIKNEDEKTKENILKRAKNITDGEGFSFKKSNGSRLVVTYSQKRANKDAHNREKGLKRLRKQMKTGKLTKSSINNRGYNKFLKMEGRINILLNEQKIEEDREWDGLKGYITNTNLNYKKISNNYSQLWQIERAFRISKTDLRVRPIYHYQQRRIEAHICIVFVAYAIYKELERLLKRKGVSMSAKRAGELTHTMYEITYTLPDSRKTERKILKMMDDEHQSLYDAVHR